MQLHLEESIRLTSLLSVYRLLENLLSPYLFDLPLLLDFKLNVKIIDIVTFSFFEILQVLLTNGWVLSID